MLLIFLGMKSLAVHCSLTLIVSSATAARNYRTRCPQSCQCSENNTLVDCRVEELWTIPTTVATLYMSGNELQVIPTQAFRNLSMLLTLERRPDFCYVDGGRVQKLHPLYLRNGLEFFDVVFTNR